MVQKYRRLGRLTVGVVSAIALGLGSCGNNRSSEELESPQGQSSPAAPSEELQVVTTFLPITQFTKAVAGDRAEVVQLLPPNVGPHDYQAKPDDARAIADADVLVKNGLEIEGFLDKLIENADNEDLALVDSSQGIETLASEEEEDHAEEEDHHHDHAEEEDHAEGEHHHHGEFDPHIWLDPKRAIQQVENIRDGLIAADPEGKAEYTANAAAYIEKLQALDAEITQQLAPYSGQTFVSFHDFALYFSDSYNLNAEHLVDVPGENPSPEDVRRIIETTKTEKIKALLTEPQVKENAFASLAKDLKVNVSVFDPIETGDSTATEPEYYLTIMRQNAKSLEEALGGSTQSRLFLWNPQPIALLPQPLQLRL